MKELIEKINLLARKSKTVGLTPAEAEEQKKLRAEYLRLFREGFKKNYLDNMYFVDENGNETKINPK
ncbi:MAG: DUF896 domain-containing protein [Firmicutes bacterium]|nr:DUF896 domain-containing protein [Bacillota bacterium]